MMAVAETHHAPRMHKRESLESEVLEFIKSLGGDVKLSIDEFAKLLDTTWNILRTELINMESKGIIEILHGRPNEYRLRGLRVDGNEDVLHVHTIHLGEGEAIATTRLPDVLPRFEALPSCASVVGLRRCLNFFKKAC